MNWFGRYRMRWIEGRLGLMGQVKRSDIVKMFEISSAQASLDLRAYMKLHPEHLRYDFTTKTYYDARKPRGRS